MKNLYKFIITNKEGIKFSKISGDNNKIHIDDITGYNSIFGTKICHGCLILIKVFKIIKINNLVSNFKEYNISINFNKHFSYEEIITIKTKKKNKQVLLVLFQNNEQVADMTINDKNLFVADLVFNKSIKFKKNNKIISYYNRFNNIGVLSMILCFLSNYVGKIYPGENSIIRSININFNKSFNFNKNLISIFSSKIDKRFPLIKNKLIFQQYIVNFETLERPKLNINLKPLNSKIKSLVKSIQENILIIGASSGIGFDVLNILKYNNKVKIIATFYKNIINLSDKNILKKKINIEKDLNLIKKIIQKYSPLVIYYFPTPKINISSNNKKSIKLYRKYYIEYPLKIMNFSKKYSIKFFYPSTVFINTKSTLNYAKIKNEAEKIFDKLKLKNFKINSLKIDEVNTKHNLSLLNRKLPHFRDLLEKNLDYQKKFFFIY